MLDLNWVPSFNTLLHPYPPPLRHCGINVYPRMDRGTSHHISSHRYKTWFKLTRFTHFCEIWSVTMSNHTNDNLKLLKARSPDGPVLQLWKIPSPNHRSLAVHCLPKVCSENSEAVSETPCLAWQGLLVSKAISNICPILQISGWVLRESNDSQPLLRIAKDRHLNQIDVRFAGHGVDLFWF